MLTTGDEDVRSEDPALSQDPSEFPGNFVKQWLEGGGPERARVHYLDHAGATLFSVGQMQEAMASMSQLQVNPHTCAFAH